MTNEPNTDNSSMNNTAPRRAGSADTETHRAGASGTVALYSTQGRYVAGSEAAEGEHDERVEQLFGQQIAIAMVDATRLYLRLKLADPPNRPQTYFARISGGRNQTWEGASNSLDAFIQQSVFEHAERNTQLQALLEEPQIVGSNDADAVDPEMIQAARRSGHLSRGVFNFTAGTITDAVGLLASLTPAIDSGVIAISDSSSEASASDSVSDVAAVISLDRGQDGVSAASNTQTALDTARSRITARKREEAIEQIERGITALSKVESDPTAVRDAVDELLPSPVASDSGQGTPRKRQVSNPDAVDSVSPSTAGGNKNSKRAISSSARQSRTQSTSTSLERPPSNRGRSITGAIGKKTGLLIFLVGLTGGIFGGAYYLQEMWALAVPLQLSSTLETLGLVAAAGVAILLAIFTVLRNRL